MASHLSQRESSQEAASGKLSLPTSEQSNHWDSPTPPMDHHTATLKDAEEAQSVIDEKLSDDPNLVTWTGPDDPANPHNWSTARKLGVSGIWVYGNVVTTIASSIFSSGAGSVVKEFHVSPTVAILGVSLFVLVRRPRTAALLYSAAFRISPLRRSCY